MRPIAVDLFAGAGGMSLGFEQAGFDIVAAVEIDPVHSAVHKFNFPQCGMIARSIRDVSGADIREAAGIGDASVDCVFGGPPCQGFSMIGHRVLDDPRNSLVLDFVRLVAELDAETFVFENVKGLTVGRHRKFLEELIQAFDAIGYQVRQPWKVLNAANFGVPQNRQRLILLGAKKGAVLPKYPTSSTRLAKESTSSLPLAPTCDEALGDLPDIDTFDHLFDSDTVRNAAFGQASTYALELRALTNDAWHFGHVRDWNQRDLTSSARTNHTEISRKRFSETRPGEVEPISRFFRLSSNGVSNTLRAGTDGARGAFTSPRPIHYRFPRCVSVREMGRLHGYPDWFRFNTTKWHGARQIGNSVPPPMARAIALKVIAALGFVPKRPGGSIKLGDPALLSFDLSSASAYFSVEKLPSRRDRKSGAVKRKQADIEAALLDSAK